MPAGGVAASRADVPRAGGGREGVVVMSLEAAGGAPTAPAMRAEKKAAAPFVTAWLALALTACLLVPGTIEAAAARLLPAAAARLSLSTPHAAAVREALPAQMSATLTVVTLGAACRLLLPGGQGGDLTAGLGFFSGSVALPAATLHAVARLELPRGAARARAFRTLWAAAAARAVGFAASLWVARQRGKRRCDSAAASRGVGGLLAIATTQTNDFAFGLSVLQALDGLRGVDMYTAVVYMLVPVQLLCFTLPGMWLLAQGASSHGHGRHLKADEDFAVAHDDVHPASRGSSAARAGGTVLVVSTARRALAFLLASPLLLAVLVGLVTNVCGGGLPRAVDEGLSTLGSSFAGTALFLVGYEGARVFPRRANLARAWHASPTTSARSAGEVRELTLTALALKLVLLPLSSVAAAMVLRLPAPDAAFVSLLGSLPSAPSLASFAQQRVPALNAVASLALVLGLLGSVPCVLACCNVIALASEW